MRLLLLRSQDPNMPDVERAMTANGEYTKDIVDFVVRNTATTEVSNAGVALNTEASSQASIDVSIGRSVPLRTSITSSEAAASSDDLTIVQLPDKLKDEVTITVGNTFAIDVLRWTQRHERGLLGHVLVHFLRLWKLDTRLQLSRSKVQRFAATIENGHRANPYHWCAQQPLVRPVWQ